MLRRIVPEVQSFYERMFRAEAELRTAASDSLTGIRVVRAFGQERREMERFAGPNRDAARLGYEADTMIGTTRSLMELVPELVLTGMWAAGAWVITRDQVTVGLLITFAGYLGRFFWPVGELVELTRDWDGTGDGLQQPPGPSCVSLMHSLTYRPQDHRAAGHDCRVASVWSRYRSVTAPDNRSCRKSACTQNRARRSGWWVIPEWVNQP